ncbi:PRC-barrel domain-containing protein [Bradyrhizobium sp. CCGUVB14]|uniref:PRC-barrel domain-containing protein n=1 Tax=Bradyrhizobium sp. CCGUVB14 TaxID=2949628 RepID=UPI0020B42398|nr:PRC-barrel domain-containing protein [Bradyrhizobium sp. CCGUVB14]MCP3440604.1 PRC-barrel domain-containing protein [Bradyrhizobium sp. CCGUVB14]
MEAIISRPLSKLTIIATTPCRPNAAKWRRYSGLAALAGILAVLSSNPALPQAGVALVKVDLSVVAQGYRMSKLIGSTVNNDKNEKIGSLDDVIAGKDKKQLDFAILQVGGFLGVGGHLVAVPVESLVIDDTGTKVTLPGASKEELKKLSEFHYRSS